MSTKTLRKRIALVAVSAMGFGLLSVVPASAAAAVTDLNLLTAGSTTAVTAGTNNAADTAYVRSGASSQTFVIEAAATLVDADDFDLVLATTGTLSEVASATTVNLTGAAVIASGETGTATTNTLAQGIGAANTDRREAAVVLPAGTVAADKVSITTGALAAGTYYLWADPSPSDPITTGGLLIATITSYDVGAPVTAEYNVVGRTIVAASAPATSAYTLGLRDSAGRSTFLVGDEVVNHAYSTVASGVQALDAVGATTAGSTPTLTGVTFAPYAVTKDTNGAGNNAALTAGVTYTLNSVIQNGVNAFGSDTVTTRWVTSTSGLAGTLTFASDTTGATVSAISLAGAQAISSGYRLTLVDSTGAVVQGVLPTASSARGATTAQAGVTGAIGRTTNTPAGSHGGSAGAWSYTAPASGTDTVTFTVTAGSSASITTSVAITIGTNYATSDYNGSIAVSSNGGAINSGDYSAGARTSSNLGTTDAIYVHRVLNPANTTSVTVTFTLLNDIAPKLPVSGAVLGFAFGATTVGSADIPTASRALSATSVTTGADGKAAVTVTVSGARDGEDMRVNVLSGTDVIGYADFRFTAAATTIADVYAGPAAVITQGAGVATVVTLTAENQYYEPVAGTRLQLSVTGPSAPVSSPVLTTGADGTVTYTVSGATAVAGQSDIVTITNINGGGSVNPDADDRVTINYLASAPVAGSVRVEYALDGSTFKNNAVDAIADAIKAINVVDAGNTNNFKGATGAGASLIGTSNLPIDTNGAFTSGTTTKSGATTAADDELVSLRFTVLTTGGTAIAGIPVVLTSSTGAWIQSAIGTAVTSRTAYTNSSGIVSFTVFATKTGTATFTATSGGATGAISVGYANLPVDARFLAVGSATESVTAGGVKSLNGIVTDRFGNPVRGVTVNWSEAGAGRFEATPSTTNASGISIADFSAIAGESGSNTVTAGLSSTTYSQVNDFANYVDSTSDSTTNGANGLTAAAVGVSSATVDITISLPTTKSAELLAIEAITAKAAADKAESDAKIALLQAALDAAATKAAADKAALEAQIAAAQAAAVAAAEAAADAAAEAIDAGNNAFDAATSAGEAADAATAAAEQAGEDATAAANAAGEAAVAAAEAATEAAAEATDAANAATDAANASAEAADAATAAAQDAADAVAALSTQVSEMISALKKQITALTNLVIKIQKKVKA